MSEQWLPSGSDQQTESERLDEELQRQIQWKLEACKKAEDLQSKLTEMCEVLQWASENVVSVEFDGRDGQWIVQRDDCDDHYAPTLYDALHKAWEGRDR